jgi:hypothetical protein
VHRFIDDHLDGIGVTDRELAPMLREVVQEREVVQQRRGRSLPVIQL